MIKEFTAGFFFFFFLLIAWDRVGGVFGRCRKVCGGNCYTLWFFSSFLCVLRCISWSGKGVVGYDHDDILSVG